MADRLPTELRQQIATVHVDMTATLGGFTLQPRDEILTRRGGGQGLKIYQDLLRDPHVAAVVGKRRRAVVARDWRVEAASDAPLDQQAAELVTQAYERIAFDHASLALLGCLLTGFAVAEVAWEVADLPGLGGRWLVPAALHGRNPRRFAYTPGMELRLLTWSAPVEGVPLPDRKFLVARYGGEDTEDPYGLGLGHQLFWPVFFKRQGIAYWNTFAEKFAQPTPVAEYDTGTTEEQRRQLLDFLGSIASQAGIVVPKGTELRLLEATRSGSIDCYERLCDFMNAEISKAVLGNTLSTQMGANGARAAAETHREVEEGLTDADCDLLSEVLYQLNRGIVEMNLPAARPPRVWREKPGQEDLTTKAERDGKVAALGFSPTREYIQETYGAHWQPRPQPALEAGRRDQLSLAAAADTDRVDTLVEEMLADWSPIMQPAVQQILDAAATAETAEQFLARLAEQPLDLSALQQQLAQATFATRIAARAGVELGGTDAEE